jgi:hypothetical protein
MTRIRDNAADRVEVVPRRVRDQLSCAWIAVYMACTRTDRAVNMRNYTVKDVLDAQKRTESAALQPKLQMKPSVKATVNCIWLDKSDPRMDSMTKLHFEVIRPFLVMHGFLTNKQERHTLTALNRATEKLSELKLGRLDALAELSLDEIQGEVRKSKPMCVEDGSAFSEHPRLRAPSRWDVIHKHLDPTRKGESEYSDQEQKEPPWGVDDAKILQAAHTSLDRSSWWFLGACGEIGPTRQIHPGFEAICKDALGSEVQVKTVTDWRILIESDIALGKNTRGDGELCVATVNGHTVSTSKKHYQVHDWDRVKKQWKEYYPTIQDEYMDDYLSRENVQVEDPESAAGRAVFDEGFSLQEVLQEEQEKENESINLRPLSRYLRSRQGDGGSEGVKQGDGVSVG